MDYCAVVNVRMVILQGNVIVELPVFLTSRLEELQGVWRRSTEHTKLCKTNKVIS